MTSPIKSLLAPPVQNARASAGLLILRLVAGFGMMLHGVPKISNPFGWMGADSWAPGFLQALAALSEFGGGIALALGALTPLASVGILGTMVVAALTHISRGDPFVGKGGSYELSAIYFAIAALILCVGPGMLSIDKFIFRRNS